MHDPLLHVVYLGEDFAWSKLSANLTDVPRRQLKLHRAQSLNELFLVLAGGSWNAVAVDIRAWEYQGLHYVEKIRSEYPAFPILALHSSSELDLSLKAKTSGASRCLLTEYLSPEVLHLAVLSCVSEKKSQFHARKADAMQLTFNIPDSHSLNSSKTQVISHALNNLLCVITANAEMLAEHVAASASGIHSLDEIKRAAKSASDLTRLLK